MYQNTHWTADNLTLGIDICRDVIVEANYKIMALNHYSDKKKNLINTFHIFAVEENIKFHEMLLDFYSNELARL